MSIELKKFQINKLYGYKDIQLIFNEKSTIIIAENGAGKTTLINALKSTLKGELDELRKIKCESIDIEFTDKKFSFNIAELSYSDFLNNALLPSRFHELTRKLKYHQVEDSLAYLLHKNIRDARQTEWYKKMYHSTPYNFGDIDSVLSEVKVLLKNYYASFDKAELFSTSKPERSKTIQAIEEIKQKTKDIEIIYLPTYRRIEKSTLRDKFTRDESEKLVVQDGEVIRIREQSESGSNIEFGLFDVESKLKELSSSIERRSSLGYRKLSATIIEDMMTGKANAPTKPKLPSVSELSRFLGRVVNKDKESNKRIIQEVTNIMENKEVLASNDMLSYFLSKLKAVIDSTKELELKIESFVVICNKYLQLSDDSKSLNFDIETLQVIVKDMHTNNTIELEDLSSGEKQIISLMAHMYLDHTKKKIVLIDEPELSLSLEWQEHVLVDIVNSPSVTQMLAITHSPFVFNNELKSQVKSLKVVKH
ncbi:AAA family ATPase [Atlantibacter hermannii]|uniref:AAA family ATPase n=2 Tax=Enterobacteriaceae TaxID=543 RepID=UPI0028AE393A|nr:AAA family ATPase [Atlantibacter hermannii]